MIAASQYPAFSRNFDDEQDYADAAASAARRASPLLRKLAPILRWRRQDKRQPPNKTNGKRRKFQTLVVGFEGGGASFARSCFDLSDKTADWIGTLILPGAVSTATAAASSTAAKGGGGLGDSFDPADPLNTACNIFRKRGKAIGDSGRASNGVADSARGDGTDKAHGNDDDDDDDVAIVLCGYRVPPAQAHAWAKALLDGIEAEVVVALTAVAIEPGRTEGWDGARLLATSEAEERKDCLQMSRGFQPLRTPAMLTGPSAALISHCQRSGRAAMCFAAAQLPYRKQHTSCLVERGLSTARKPLAMLVGDVMVSPSGGSARLSKTRGDNTASDEFVDSTSNLYV